jgi:CRP/FNR family transcriptional regulator, cyclic AMP receptor protein
MKLPNIFESNTNQEAYAAGVAIFSSGDKGDSMYVVKKGEVEIKVGDKVVEIVGAEGFFGEMALIEAGPRTASAIAKTDCLLVPINGQRFEFMVHEVPFFALEIMKGLSRRLRKVDGGV